VSLQVDDGIRPNGAYSVFVHESVDLELAYFLLLPHISEDPQWLAPLAMATIAEAIDREHSQPGAPTDEPTVLASPGALQCQLGPIRLRTSAVTLPMRWTSELGSQLFPERVDADLYLHGTGDENSQLALAGTYKRPADAELDRIQRVTKSAVRTYLGSIATVLLA